MSKKTNRQSVFILAVFLAGALIIGWSGWSVSRSIVISSPSSAYLAAENLLTARTKLEIVAELLRGRQYGQWPLAAAPLSEDRGNPFIPKK